MAPASKAFPVIHHMAAGINVPAPAGYVDNAVAREEQQGRADGQGLQQQGTDSSAGKGTSTDFSLPSVRGWVGGCDDQVYEGVARAVPVQRLYELAVEVWSGPSDGPFRNTKVVSIKSKYLLLNDTGMCIEYKQKGTPDSGDPRYLGYGHGRRYAGPLEPTER